MQMLLGEYGSTAPPETLLDKRDTGGPSPDLVHLRGARLAVVSESRDDSVLREAVVKRLTGQDRIVCRDLYLGLFEYVPTFKFVLATNSKPIIHGTDHAIWRRIRLIPFKVIISSEQQDRQLSSQIAVLTLGSQEK
jgi:putative DNA primase/helicase